MKTSVTINSKKVEISAGITSGKSLYTLADCGEKCLYLNRDDKLDIPVQPDDYIIVHGNESFVAGKPGTIEDNPPLRNPICPAFNGKKLSFSNAKIMAKDLIAMDDKFPQGRLFADFKDSVDAEIQGGIRLILQDKDEYFVIPPASDDSTDASVDVEECAKNDRRPPKAANYRINIDGQKYNVHAMTITGAAILSLAGKNLGEWSLNQKFKGGKREAIKPDEAVDLTKSGVERFETVPKVATQGMNEVGIELQPEEKEYLNANYPGWEMLPWENGKVGVLIADFPLPSGYTANNSNMMVVIPEGYPGTPLDMFHFDPPLSKADGSGIAKLTSDSHFGQTWQGWSRHYQHPWEPGIHSIISHLEFVKNVLEQEVAQ